MVLWNQLNPESWLALLAEDIHWYYGDKSLEREGVEQMVRGLMSVLQEPGYRVLSDPDVQILGPNAAVASFLALQAATGPAGERLELPTGLTFIYQRLDGEWKIARVHESLGTPADSIVANIILARTRELAAAWKRLDPEAYLAHFSDDLIFYFDGRRLERQEFETVVRETLASLRESTFEVLDPEVEVLGPAAAAVTFGVREVMVDTAGATTDIEGVLTLVFETRRGRWLVVRAHESLRRPD
ncbi:MAG TPA: SgcJ/EcaC family oxidoreductase [Longimicrobiales bacterium]|nr:SgcJ/EcaC family oxidoreductase [Longimicrobiales bacterium]